MSAIAWPRMRMRVQLAVALVLVWIAGAAQAHRLGESLLEVALTPDALQLTLDVGADELNTPAFDASAAPGESRAAAIAALLARVPRQLQLQADGRDCAPGTARVAEHRVDSAPGWRIQWQVVCPGRFERLSIESQLFAGLDPAHRVIGRLDAGSASRPFVLAADSPKLEAVIGDPDRAQVFWRFLVDGVWHIAIGADHVLFLVSLLLPAVLIRQAGRWRAAPSLRPVAIASLKVVTAFTAAHSITLVMAALHWVDLPSRWVESAIALSVLVLALNNLMPRITDARWHLAAAFGLVHGFGFASVLAELGLPSSSLVLALAAFNIGVEIGQLAIVALLLPVAFVLRRTRLYRLWLMPISSVLIAAVALVWLLQRLSG